MKYIEVKLKDVVSGKEIGTLVAESKQFSSGSIGFYAGGKTMLPTGTNGDLQAYQCSMSIVLVGSKPKVDTKPTAPAKK